MERDLERGLGGGRGRDERGHVDRQDRAVPLLARQVEHVAQRVPREVDPGLGLQDLELALRQRALRLDQIRRREDPGGDLPAGQPHLLLGTLLRSQLEIVTVQRLHDIPVRVLGALDDLRRADLELAALALGRDLRLHHLGARHDEIGREPAQQRLRDRDRQRRAIVERLDRGAGRRPRTPVLEVDREPGPGLELVAERDSPVVGDEREDLAGAALLHGQRRLVAAVVIVRRRQRRLEVTSRDVDAELRGVDLGTLEHDAEVLAQRDSGAPPRAGAATPCSRRHAPATAAAPT